MHRTAVVLRRALGATATGAARLPSRPLLAPLSSSATATATAAAGTSTHSTRRGPLLLGATAAATTLCAAHIAVGGSSPAHMSNLARPAASAPRVPATADLCDEHEGSLQVADPAVAFRAFGRHGSFGGEIETVKCFENNPLVRSTLSEPGGGKVLVVDGGGSLRRALFGDNIAALAVQNGWAGVIIYGAIRDSEQIDQMPLGVRALGTNPIKSSKKHPGEKGVEVAFAGVTFKPGHFVYADKDGIVVSAKPLH